MVGAGPGGAENNLVVGAGAMMMADELADNMKNDVQRPMYHGEKLYDKSSIYTEP